MVSLLSPSFVDEQNLFEIFQEFMIDRIQIGTETQRRSYFLKNLVFLHSGKE